MLQIENALPWQMQAEMEVEEKALDERLAEASKGRRRPRRQEEEEARERDKDNGIHKELINYLMFFNWF